MLKESVIPMREDICLEFAELTVVKPRVYPEKRSAADRQERRKQEIRKRRKRRQLIKRLLLALFVVLLFLCIFALLRLLRENNGTWTGSVVIQEGEVDKTWQYPHPPWTEDYLTVSEYSRPGTPLKEVKDIFVHYTANPKTNAAQNRSYFEQLKDTQERSASAHFIIGYEGDIIQCIPLDEIGYAVKTRNEDSISIECCYLAQDGAFTKETYESLLELSAWLLREYDLTTDNLLRHYDCGGKKCPLYYVEHEDEWEQLKKDVQKKLE